MLVFAIESILFNLIMTAKRADAWKHGYLARIFAYSSWMVVV